MIQYFGRSANCPISNSVGWRSVEKAYSAVFRFAYPEAAWSLFTSYRSSMPWQSRLLYWSCYADDLRHA